MQNIMRQIKEATEQGRNYVPRSLWPVATKLMLTSPVGWFTRRGLEDRMRVFYGAY